MLATQLTLIGGLALGDELPELDCVLAPSKLVEISSSVEGVIESIYVQRNDTVTKDQLLVELDSGVEKSQVALAHARAKLETNIRLKQTINKFEQRKKERIQTLFATNAVPLHIKDESTTDAQRSTLELLKARDDKRLAQLELRQSTSNPPPENNEKPY